ncbi:chemotaxis protein CheB [Hydrocarboniphaga sp.]|uniref:chemotaxis protein CheB n=1 Tax=Hydrocarboniphaga sp. TaxID=2033016 RepID=UPI003D0C27AF
MSPFDTLKGRVDGIVIGASAGGVEALSVLLPALPKSLQASVFVVLHIPRERPSLLVEIFRPKCAMAVIEAMDKEPAEKSAIYFAPPDYHLLVDKGPQLSLSADELVNFSRPSIDVLFESAADVYRKRLLGIVLSGGNDDGAAGLQAVIRAGGIGVVQQPDSAQVSAMPLAAIKRGGVDYVLTLPEIAELLKSL